MDNKTKFRILSKIGLLLVFIGFFMPVSCNLNGFQLAKSLETLGGPNIVSISLYLIFIGSCIGLFLLLLLLMKIKYNITYDWALTILIVVAFVYFVFVNVKDKNDPFLHYLFRFQSGAYIIFSGIMISIISLICALSASENNTPVAYKEEQALEGKEEEQQETEEKFDPSSLTTVQKTIIKLAKNKIILTAEYILDNSDLSIEEIETAFWTSFCINKQLKFAWKITISAGEHFYCFQNENVDILDADFLSLFGKYSLSKLKKLYRDITGKDKYESEIYIGKLYYLYINKLGTKKEWNKKELELKKLIEKIDVGYKPIYGLMVLSFLWFVFSWFILSIKNSTMFIFNLGPIIFSILCFIIYDIISIKIIRKKVKINVS
jgi:hypothetical protein